VKRFSGSFFSALDEKERERRLLVLPLRRYLSRRKRDKNILLPLEYQREMFLKSY
jgi:hypothetical protein